MAQIGKRRPDPGEPRDIDTGEGEQVDRVPNDAVLLDPEPLAVQRGRAGAQRPRQVTRRPQRRFLFAPGFQPLPGKAADPGADRAEPLVGVVRAQPETILGPRGEHPVRFADALGHQIVDQHADIGVSPVQDQGRPSGHRQTRVEPSHQALRRSFLVPRRPVDLAGEVQAWDHPRPQRVVERPWIDVVVLDRVARPDHAGIFQPGNGPEQRLLHIAGQGGRNPVRIDRVVVEPFRLEVDLMARFVGEADDLVLDRRAIARPGAADLAGIDRRAMQVGADQIVAGGAGMGQMTGDLRRRNPLGHIGEGRRFIVARLDFEPGPVDGPAVQARRRSRLEPPQRKPELAQGARQPVGGRIADPSGRNLLLADMDHAAEERPGRQHDGRGRQHRTVAGDDTGRTAGIVQFDILDRSGPDFEIFLGGEGGLHRLAI